MDKRISDLKKSATERLPSEVVEVMKRCQQLRELGKTDAEIEKVIHSLNLPMKYHMFILGNYSRLMANHY